MVGQDHNLLMKNHKDDHVHNDGDVFMTYWLSFVKLIVCVCVCVRACVLPIHYQPVAPFA